MAKEIDLGITIVSAGGVTMVPERVKKLLGLESAATGRKKLLWSQEEDEVVVEKGSLRSSFRKSLLRIDGKTTIPKHVRSALKLEPSLYGRESVSWLCKGDKVVVRRGTPRSVPTD